MARSSKHSDGNRRAGPKLPHERDEGAAAPAEPSAAGRADDEKMRRARSDLESGRQDTGRGPVADQTYHDLRKKQ
jgi:hypothetical protein